MQNQTILSNTDILWASYLSPKVGQTVRLGLNIYQNKTGKNSNPQLGLDWSFVCQVDAGKDLKIWKKKAGNVSEDFEPGDLGYGLLNDGVTFIPIGRYENNDLGGGVQNINNWYTSPIDFT